MFGAEDAAIMKYQAERKQKQQYLKENIIDIGYDASHFAEYMAWQREDGTNIDNWSIDDLAQCVSDYYVWYEQQYQQQQQPVDPAAIPYDDRAQSIAYMNKAMDQAEQ